MKHKWKYLSKIKEILNPYLITNGNIKLTEELENDVAYLLALIINCEFTLSENEIAQFGADDIVPIQLKIKNNIIRNFGKIYWLSTPKNHKCFKTYQDPFYGEFEIVENTLQVKKMKFGNVDIVDLDNDNWINNDLDWMFEIF